MEFQIFEYFCFAPSYTRNAPTNRSQNNGNVPIASCITKWREAFPLGTFPFGNAISRSHGNVPKKYWCIRPLITGRRFEFSNGVILVFQIIFWRQLTFEIGVFGETCKNHKILPFHLFHENLSFVKNRSHYSTTQAFTYLAPTGASVWRQ